MYSNTSKFQTYLEDITQKSNLYTLTNAEGKVFDVGLMVKTWQPNQREAAPDTKKQVISLRKIANKIAVDVLIATCFEQKDLSIRSCALSQLKYLGVVEAISLLIKALQDKEPEIKKKSISELRKIGKAKIDSVIDAIIETFRCQELDVRLEAIYALNYFIMLTGNIRAINGLSQALDDEDSYVSYCAASLLKGSPSSENLDYTKINSILNAYHEETIEEQMLIDDLNKEYDQSSNQASIYIDYISTEIYYGMNHEYDIVEKFLSDALQDENLHIRNAALEELVAIRSDMAVDSLIFALQRKDLCINNKAASALRNNASSNILSKMWKLLLNDVYDTRNIILGIQERCKFYNHEIFHSPAVKNSPGTSKSPHVTYDMRGATIGNVANTVHGNQQALPPQYNEEKEGG